MLKITEGQVIALTSEARTRLRSLLLQHWSEQLWASGDIVRAEGCEQVVREMERLAAEEASLDLADLIIIADLRLVALAGEIRKSQVVLPH